jgi:putative transposase
MNNKQVVKINRYFPSSKTCHCCGWIKEDLTLNDREWSCPNCGEVLDRDINAAMNILREGLRNISAGTVDYTDGANVRPFQGQFAEKSEANKLKSCG